MIKLTCIKPVSYTHLDVYKRQGRIVSSGDYEKNKMHKRASSLRQTKEAEKEVRVAEKEVTSVEDVETVAREEVRGDPNLLKIMELMNSMNEKFDKNEESLKQMKEETNDNFKKQEEKINKKLYRNSVELKKN